MKTPFFTALLAVLLFTVTIKAQETEATRLLKEQNKEFVPEIFKYGENVWFAVGYDVSNVAMIEGKTGIIGGSLCAKILIVVLKRPAVGNGLFISSQ